MNIHKTQHIDIANLNNMNEETSSFLSWLLKNQNKKSDISIWGQKYN